MKVPGLDEFTTGRRPTCPRNRPEGRIPRNRPLGKGSPPQDDLQARMIAQIFEQLKGHLPIKSFDDNREEGRQGHGQRASAAARARGAACLAFSVPDRDGGRSAKETRPGDPVNGRPRAQGPSQGRPGRRSPTCSSRRTVSSARGLYPRPVARTPSPSACARSSSYRPTATRETSDGMGHHPEGYGMWVSDDPDYWCSDRFGHRLRRHDRRQRPDHHQPVDDMYEWVILTVSKGSVDPCMDNPSPPPDRIANASGHPGYISRNVTVHANQDGRHPRRVPQPGRTWPDCSSSGEASELLHRIRHYGLFGLCRGRRTAGAERSGECEVVSRSAAHHRVLQ